MMKLMDLDTQTTEEMVMIIDADKLAQGIKMLTDTLERHIVTITFTKADGSERVMRCTKKLAAIPENRRPTPVVEEVHHDNDPQLFRVYDLEKDGWRSFYYTTIKTMNIEDN